MDINLSISQAPSIATNYLVVAVYEANPDSSMGPLLASQAFAAPHTSSQNVTFTGLDPQVCVVVVYENSTTSPGGTIRHQFIYDPSFSSATVKEDVWLTVGSTTGFTAGATSFTPADNSWDGWDYEIEIRGGYGQLQGNGVDWTKITSPHYGFTVGIPGYTFASGEIYVVHFYPKITVVTPSTPSGGTKLFQSVKVVTVDTSLSNTDMGSAVFIEGANPLVTVTLPDITTVNQNALLPIYSGIGSHINADIKAFGTQKIKFMTGLVNDVVMGQSEQLWAFKWVDPLDSSNYHWKIINASEGLKMVGQLVSCYKLPVTVDPVNLLFCDGSLKSRTSYKRLWNWVNTLDASMLITDAAWSTDTGKFSTGDGSTTFRLPRLYDQGFMKGVDSSTRKAGSYEADTVGPLGSIQVRNGTGGSSTNPLDGGNSGDAGFSGMDFFGSWLANGSVGLEKWIKIASGTETKPKNIGTYLLIRI